MGKQRKNTQKENGFNLEGTNMPEPHLQIRGYLQKKKQIVNLQQIKGKNFLEGLLMKEYNITASYVSMNLFS